MANRNNAELPRPDFARLLNLADEVIATLNVGVYDEDQRMLLIGEARDLMDRIKATLVEIEEADPSWSGWAVIEPPLGTMAERYRRHPGVPPRHPLRRG